MELTSFRRIGLIYAVLCFLGSCYGVVLCFKALVEREFFCGEIDCSNGTGTTLLTLGIQALLLALSSMFCVFIKIGIEEVEPAHIRSYRVFMLIRNIIFVIQLTYETVQLTIDQINGDKSAETLRHQQITSALLLAVSLIVGVELWIIDGVERYINSMLSGEFYHRRSRDTFDS